MKKKVLTALLTAMLALSLVACGGSDSKNSETSSEDTKKEADSIEVEKELFDVVVTLPADFVGETTQEELDASAEEYGYKVVLNEDGSATYTMTKRQHKKLMEDTKSMIEEGLQDMTASEEYPNFTKVESNSDFTSFTITTTSTELDLNESFSVMIFYMYGGMYSNLNGAPADNIHVDFVNADSGQVISSADSKDME